MSDESDLTRSARHEKRETGGNTQRGPRWFWGMPTWARTTLISVVLACAVVAAGVATDVAVSFGRIHPGVYIGDLDVGGMTVDEAAGAIDELVAARTAEPLVVTANGASWEVTAADIGFAVDAQALANGAYAHGRGALGDAILERLDAFLRGITVPLTVGCDEEAMSALITDINTVVATAPVNAAVVVDGTSVTRTEPVNGYGVEATTAREAILLAFLSGDDTLELELVDLLPAVDLAGAQAAYDAALAMVSGPVTLYYEDKEWEVPAESIGPWIAFRTVDTSGTAVLEAYISAEEVSATVLPMVSEVGRPAKDATFSVSSGTVTIVPGESGLATDAADLATRLLTVLRGSSDRRAELTMQTVEPAITTEDAQSMGIVERLGTFTTEYASSNRPRVHNIHLLADALDGTLVAPGETFSFNGTVGERTAAKGYQEAGAIVNGELVPQLGGGICQVGTTIFNAVFFSGLPVTERHNHSLYISHYPTGRDATVSWGGPDFQFQNDTDNYILIATSYTSSSVTVSIYGTNPGYTVTYDTGAWTNIVAPTVKQIEDATLPVGVEVVETVGQSGRTIVVTRHVMLNGTEIRTDTFKSVYRAVQEVVRVGTMVTDSTTPTGTP